MRHDRVQTVNRLLDQIDAGTLGGEMETEAGAIRSVLEASGIAFAAIGTVYELDMLYLGQTHTVSVTLDGAGAGLTGDAIRTAFERAYRAAYGRLLDGIPMRVMNYRVAVIGRRPGLDMAVFAPSGGKPADACRTGTRTVWCDGAAHEAGVYERLDLAVGERIAGPALMEQADTTIFVDPGLAAEVDRFGNLVIRRMEAGHG